MPDILIRGLEPETIRQWKSRAKRNGRSRNRSQGTVPLAQREIGPEGSQPMKAAVVDASVIMAAFFPEPLSREAKGLLDSGIG
jgi:hypothetical protein